MTTVHIGDTIYTRQEAENWQQYLCKMIVDEILSWPAYPRGRETVYRAHFTDGPEEWDFIPRRRCFTGTMELTTTRRPRAGLPILTTAQQVSDFTNANRLPRNPPED